MKKIIFVSSIIILLAGSSFSISLEKRHAITLEFGIWAQTNNSRTEIGIGGVETSVDKNGMLAALGYSHWFEENLALTLDLKIQALDVSTNINYYSSEFESSVVSSILMGMKYYFLKSTLTSSFRPYLKAAAGPYIGEQSSESAGSVVLIEKRTEVSYGGNISFGADIITGRHFMLGVVSGYNFMSDFSEPIGGSKNYSGPEFGFSVSWLIGKGVSN